MERRSGDEKGVYHQIRVNMEKPSRSGEFDLRNLIPAFAQRHFQSFQMRAVAGFAFDVSDQALGGQCGENPLVIDFDDIDALFGEDPHDME